MCANTVEYLIIILTVDTELKLGIRYHKKKPINMVCQRSE